MFGIGLWEIVAVFAVIIVLIKPADLPVFIRNLGRLYRSFREFYKTATETAKRIEAEILESESSLATASAKSAGENGLRSDKEIVEEANELSAELK